MKKYRAILFDAGDTLLFPKPSREAMFQQVAQQLGLSLSLEAIQRGYRHLDRYLAQYGRDLPREGLDGDAAYNALILEGAGFDGALVTCATSIAQAFRAIEQFEFQVYPETRHLLARLAQVKRSEIPRIGTGYKLGIVSNWDESLEGLCVQLGIRHFFDVIVASQVVGVSKPDPRIFSIALQHLQVEPSEAIHIGDLYHADVVGARNAGLTPILYDWKGCFPDAESLRIERLNQLSEILYHSAEFVQIS